jgi:hypothetical protein
MDSGHFVLLAKAILYHSLEPIESQKIGHSFIQLLENAPYLFSSQQNKLA